MVPDADFQDLKGTLEWGSKLELTPLQRAELKYLCFKITGSEASIPSWRLKEEAGARRDAVARAEAAEKRVEELEAKLEEVRAQQRRWWRR
jgi:hypothetical protein